MMRILVAAFMGIMLVQPTSARITDENRAWIAQLTPADRDYLRSQVNPVTRVNCCSEADGEEVEETQHCDGADCVYEVRSARTQGKWVIVPKDAVLTTPNIHGRAVVWWKYPQASDPSVITEIRCFASGSGF